jgi:5'-3' exonuclease
MQPALFVDGRNTAYRAIYAGRGNDEFTQQNYHPFVIWMRFARTWIEKFKPKSVHVFWDTPKSQVWRKKILPEYKENRVVPTDDARDITKDLEALEQAAMAVLPTLNVRCYRRETQEADDLIYSGCKVINPDPVIVISSDSDMMQLPWSMRNVTCYEPKLNKIQPTPDISPVQQKALAGDSSDNIDGYRGIGDIKSAAMVRDKKLLMEFLQVRGDKEYRRNLALIDLSYNPSRLTNDLYVQQVMQADLVFNPQGISQLIAQHKIKGLMNEYSRFLGCFRKLGEV